MRKLPLLAFFVCLVGGASGAATQGEETRCVKLGATTVFAPRGEVYVSVEADCKERDFPFESSILAYLEVVVDHHTVLGRDIRIEPEVPSSRQTFAFENLDLVKDQPLLIRITISGKIVALQTVRVP